MPRTEKERASRRFHENLASGRRALARSRAGLLRPNIPREREPPRVIQESAQEIDTSSIEERLDSMDVRLEGMRLDIKRIYELFKVSKLYRTSEKTRKHARDLARKVKGIPRKNWRVKE